MLSDVIVLGSAISAARVALIEGLPTAPAKYGGALFPIQVQNGLWSGFVNPDFIRKQVEVRDSKKTLMATYPISDFSSDCPSGASSGWAQFKIPGLGDGNTWVLLEKYSNGTFMDKVLWYGVMYSRNY